MGKTERIMVGENAVSNQPERLGSRKVNNAQKVAT